MKRLLAVLGLLAVSASCASAPHGGWDKGYGAPCPELTVVNRSWEDIVIRTDLSRVGDVGSQQTRTFRVCNQAYHPQRVLVDAIGDRYRYWVTGSGSWGAADAWTVIVAVIPAHSQWQPTPRTER